MATGISEKMGGPHIKDSLSLWTQTISPTSNHVCLFCNKSHNSRDSLMNHIQFHYRMVLVCPICGGCITSRKVKPGEPQWRRLDLLLMNHTQAPEMEATLTLTVWPDPPNDEESAHGGQIFKCIWKKLEAQVANIKGAVAAEAQEADKSDDVAVDKNDSNQATSKLKQSTHHSKKKKKDSSKRIKPPDDNLNEYFGLSQSQNSQETDDGTPVNTPEKSEEAKSKNDPDGSSR